MEITGRREGVWEGRQRKSSIHEGNIFSFTEHTSSVMDEA